MADADDFGDYGSHFLDSMLEVEMTEEDGEVNVSVSDEQNNCRELPPIPRFDLQSETLTYKDTYSNSTINQKQSSVSNTKNAQVLAPPISVPVIQSSPMLVIRSDLLKNSTSLKTDSSVPSAKSATPKTSPVLKSFLTDRAALLGPANEFQEQVFKSDYVKKVFSKPEPSQDVTEFCEEEVKFYEAVFQDVSKVQWCKLHCTICDRHLGCGKDVEKRLTVHSMLKVLICKICDEFYGDGNFPCDEGDHCEIYCRWCGQGGALVCCSFCPKVFCKRCVRRNFGRALLRSIERASDWACFICAQKPLWPHRAICKALLEYFKQKKQDPKALTRDTSMCCKTSLFKKKSATNMDKNKIVISGGHAFQLNSKAKEPVIVTGTDAKNKVFTPLAKSISGNRQLIVKNISSGLKVGDKKQSTITVIKPQSLNISPKIKNASSLSKSNVSKTLNSVPLPSLKTSSLPQIINTPIYHGQTLITPPGARQNFAQRKPLNIPCKTQSSPVVKVSVTDAVNVDINKIPIAKIPHNVQGLILRMNFPDNRVQLIRLITEENCNEEGKNFPMPTFENSENLDFLEGSLEDSFKLTKMLYERLLKIKEKINSKTKNTKQGVYNSSVKKLSFIYAKARELMKELNDNLISNYESWKYENEHEKEVSVIELSDDEKANGSESVSKLGRKTAKSTVFGKKSKSVVQDYDSDVEVLSASAGRRQLSQRALRSITKKANDSGISDREGKLLAKIRERDLEQAPKNNCARQGKSQRPVYQSLQSNKLPICLASKRRKILLKKQRKRIKLSDNLNNVLIKDEEKDPLAVSDVEETEINGEPEDYPRSIVKKPNDAFNSFNNEIEIKEERNDNI